MVQRHAVCHTVRIVLVRCTMYTSCILYLLIGKKVERYNTKTWVSNPMIAEATQQWAYMQYKTPLIHWKGVGWYDYEMSVDKHGDVICFYAGFHKWKECPNDAIAALTASGWVPYVKNDNFVGLRQGREFRVFQNYNRPFGGLNHDAGRVH